MKRYNHIGQSDAEKLLILLEENRKLKAEIAALEEEYRWIPVREKLPEVEGWYETIRSFSNKVGINYFRKYDRKKGMTEIVNCNTFVDRDVYGRETIAGMIYWRKLPKLPPGVKLPLPPLEINL